MGNSQRVKGRGYEQEVARLMGGKRNVMSGGSPLGGGDLHFPPDSIYADFLWELKRYAVRPGVGIVKPALAQAEVAARAVGARKQPAVITRGDSELSLVHMRLNDFVQWSQALSEVGQGAAMKSTIRQIRHQLDDLERRL